MTRDDLIKAIPTMVDGIQFRSRLEATWFLYLVGCGFKVEYEPYTLEPKMLWESEQGVVESLGLYTPDFRLIQEEILVEIKPQLKEYGQHDRDSITRAYVVGYDMPIVIVLGTPRDYFAALVNERHKGSPGGCVVRFLMEPARVHAIGNWGADCYPDEQGLGDWCDPRQNMCTGDRESRRSEYPAVAARAWNATQWKAR